MGNNYMVPYDARRQIPWPGSKLGYCSENMAFENSILLLGYYILFFILYLAFENSIRATAQQIGMDWVST